MDASADEKRLFLFNHFQATPSSMFPCAIRAVKNLKTALPVYCIRLNSSSAGKERSENNIVTKNKDLFVCHHPRALTPFSQTTPLHHEVEIRPSLTTEESKMVDKLRNKDPFIWSIGTLAKLFNVSRLTIRRAASLSSEKKNELKNESAVLKGAKHFKRKKLLKKREEERRVLLKKALEEMDYKFPGKLDTDSE